MKDPLSLLLIDDDPILTQVLARAFKRRGYHVLEAHNRAQALEHCRQSPIDRCVLDLKIADESGLPMIPELLEIHPQLNIVMLTGFSSINTAVEAIKLGANQYLCKPADANDIEQAFEKTEGDSDVFIQDSPPSVNRLEWEHIQKVLADNDGNISATARALGMHRRTLQRKLQKKPVKS